MPDWWTEASTAPPERWGALFTAAGRRLGPELQEKGRIRLLVHAAGQDHARFLELVRECHRSGDQRERCAMLRALPLVPIEDELVRIAIDACRTSVVPVFEAIACDNRLPAAA